MKVVIFCGGLGLRMRSGVDSAPKPMMSIGDRPVLWHIMRYYAHFGHTEFILCLGYGAQTVKQYFLDYQETHSNDFVLTRGGQDVELLDSDISDWRITFVDTGIETSIGERLRRVRKYLDGDEVFLANYGDVLTDAPMDRIVADFTAGDATASLLAVPPQASFHTVEFGPDARITGLRSADDLPLWINGGYFVIRQEVFDVLAEGEDLVGHAYPRLARRGKLLAVPYHGFWAAMDTLKERQTLETMWRTGDRPWSVWARPTVAPASRPAAVPDVPGVADVPEVVPAATSDAIADSTAAEPAA